MHEFSLINSLFNRLHALLVEHQATRIVGVKIRLGALAHISPEHFCEHFVEAAKGGPAEHARIEVRVDPDQHSPTAQDIVLESIEVED